MIKDYIIKQLDIAGMAHSNPNLPNVPIKMASDLQYYVEDHTLPGFHGYKKEGEYWLVITNYGDPANTEPLIRYTLSRIAKTDREALDCSLNLINFTIQHPSHLEVQNECVMALIRIA